MPKITGKLKDLVEDMTSAAPENPYNVPYYLDSDGIILFDAAECPQQETSG